MTTVVNMRKKKGQPSAVYDRKIDRSTIFGNPFDHQKLGITREECVRRYREYFYNKLKDSQFRSKVEELKNKRLGCWCKPDNCHGDVIVEYLEYGLGK